MKKTGTCKLCLAENIEYTKSDIVPKWFIKSFKEGDHGGKYVDALQSGRDGEPGKLDDAYFVDDEALCSKCNNETFSAWEKPSKTFYNDFLVGNEPHYYGPWFYSFCTSLSWRVLAYLQRVGTRRETLDNPRVADALESWRLFMMTGQAHHIKGHSQHLFLTDPTYAAGIGQAFRLFDVVHLTGESDKELVNALEAVVGFYRPEDACFVTAAKSKVRQAGWGNDRLTLTFFGCFTLIGLISTDVPEQWRNCGRLAVNGGRLEHANTVNPRLLLAMLGHDLKMWAQLHEQGNEQMARTLYDNMIGPFTEVFCSYVNP